MNESTKHPTIDIVGTLLTALDIMEEETGKAKRIDDARRYVLARKEERGQVPVVAAQATPRQVSDEARCGG